MNWNLEDVINDDMVEKDGGQRKPEGTGGGSWRQHGCNQNEF